MNSPTIVYLAYDKKSLYVAFDCQEPEMDSIQKDSLWVEGLELFLMPSLARGDYFQMGLTPRGTCGVFWKGEIPAGDMGIKTETKISADSWQAEIEVPFSSLQTTIPEPGSVWKICLARTRKNALTAWPRLSGNCGYHDVENYADLVFEGDHIRRVAGVEDRILSIHSISEPLTIDGSIEEYRMSSARVTGLAPLPVRGDHRLKKVASIRQIQELIHDHYKDTGYTTSLTREKVALARKLIDSESWAKTVFEKIKNTADYWQAKSDCELYDMIPTGGPMAFGASYSYGCPVCGTGDGWYANLALHTSLTTPNQWQCKTCERSFGPGEKVEHEGQEFLIVDNGSGWVVPDGLPGAGHACYFVGAWRNYFLGVLIGSSRTKALTRKGDAVPIGGLSALALVYALTGEKTYAHKALLILARLAQLHPTYDGMVDIGRPVIMPHIAYTTGGAEDIVNSCAHAYDMVFERLAGDDELVAFFRNKGHKDWDEDGVITEEDLRRSIAVNLFGYMFDWLLRVRKDSTGDDWTIGHAGWMVLIGRLLQNPEMVEEALAGEKGFYRLMVERHLNDGRFFYNSLSYHCGKPGYFSKVLFESEGYRDGILAEKPLHLLADNDLPFTRLLDYAAGVLCAGRVPGIGDGVIPRHRVDPCKTDPWNALFDLVPKFHWLTRTVRDKAAFIVASQKRILEALPQDALQMMLAVPEIEKAFLKERPYQPQRTRLFTDSGLAILRTDDDGLNQIHVLLNYGVDGMRHTHRDLLSLNILAYGYEMTINKGYPYSGITNVKVPGWVASTAAQNVVRIDGSDQSTHRLLQNPIRDFAGNLHAFADNPLVAMAEGCNEKVYPQHAKRYRRGVLLVKDRNHPFIVDIVSVDGGQIRDYQFHAQSDIRGHNFEITLEDGSLLHPMDGSLPYIDPRFIYDITASKTIGGIKARWWIDDENNTGLLFYMQSGEQMRTVITGKGQAEGSDKPVPCDPHLIVREEGDRPSQFVSVLFPYRNTPPSVLVQTLPLPPATGGKDKGVSVRVVVGDRAYVLFHDLHGNTLHTVSHGGHTYTFRGKLGVIAERNGRLEAACLSCGTRIGRDEEVFQAPAAKTGEVTAVLLPEKSILVKGLGEEPKPGALIKWAQKPWVYRVVKSEKNGDVVKLHFDTFSLLDKGRYPMVEEKDEVFVLNELYIDRHMARCGQRRRRQL